MECLIVTSGIHRPLANFSPDLWGDRFLNYTPRDQTQKEQEAQELKEVVREKLTEIVKDPKERLEYIDALHKLGVAYHFETEIEENLQSFHKQLQSDNSYGDDLHYIALVFRLLRQHGFYVSSEIFDKFKCENGSFEDSLGSDIEGILNLYEASFLGVHGENTLEEAHGFATAHLKSFASTHLDSGMTQQILHALKIPLHRRSIRLESRYQISFYESKPSHHKTLLRFAKLDFNLLQSLHNLELREYTRWWRSFNSMIKLPNFMRNRVVESYFWNLSTFYEPKYKLARMFVNKIFGIASILDDLYDAYGTIDELEIFTQAIQRWDKSFTNQLPDYLKLFYEAILDTFEEFLQHFAKEGRQYVVHYMQQQLMSGCEAYLKEAKLLNQKIALTYDEYLENAAKSSGYLLIIAASFMGMGEIASKEAFEWLNLNSSAPRASCIIGRLLDDIAGHKVEQAREHVDSSVECYMRQFGVSEEEAYEKIQCHIEESWKDLNRALFRPTVVPMPLMTRVINLTRTLYDIYQVGEDAYTMPKYLKPKIEVVFSDPIVL